MAPAPTLVLLPGLDGSSELARRFLELAPADLRVVALSLQHEPDDSYAALAARMQPLLPPGPLLLIGNSFSGPLALRLANQVELLGLVLCATFVRAPLPAVLSKPLSFFSKARPSAASAAIFLTDGDTALAEELALAVSLVPREVAASRMRMVMAIEATSDLAACSCPVLYLRATRDLLVSDRQLELIRSIRPDVESHDLDTGHLVLQLRPRLAWARIQDFARHLTK